MDNSFIRAIMDADVPAVHAIYSHEVLYGSASFETEPPSLDAMFERVAATRQEDLPFLVAETADQIVGYAYCGPYRARHAYRFTLENSVYLRQGMQGRGIGTALLSALLDDISGSDYQQIVAVIGDSANAGSIRMHEKQGFEHIGILRNVGFKHGRWLDTVLMQKSLK